MMKYQTTRPEGTFVLAHHTLEEWAKETYERLIAFGCSESYAKMVRMRISRAKAV